MREANGQKKIWMKREQKMGDYKQQHLKKIVVFINALGGRISAQEQQNAKEFLLIN